MTFNPMAAFQKGYKEADKSQKEVWQEKDELTKQILKIATSYNHPCPHCEGKGYNQIELNERLGFMRTPDDLKQILKMLKKKNG